MLEKAEAATLKGKYLLTRKKARHELFAKRNDRATVSTSKSNVFIMNFWKKKVEGVRSLEKRNQSHI